jgi:hypothetical protein
VTDEHERFVDEVAAYALGSLDDDERERVATHVAECSVCAGLLADYEFVSAGLGLAPAPTTPPAAAWTAIHAAACRRPTRPSAARIVTRVPQWLRAARWPAVAAVVLGLLGWNLTLERELARRSPGPAPGPEVEALSRRPGRLVVLHGTGRPGASARIFVAVDGGGHLAVSGLAPLPSGRIYQVWFRRDGADASSGATFGVDASGRAWVKVNVPAALDGVRAIDITEEPAPGSAAPTGHGLLVARPWP